MGDINTTKDAQEIYVLPDSSKLQAPVETLKNRLKNYEEKIKSRFIILPILGTILAILLAFVTADFKDSFGISGETWFAFFLLLFIILVCAFFYYVKKWYPDRNLNSDKFIDNLISECSE